MKNIKFEASNLFEKIDLDEDCNAILKSLLDGAEDRKSVPEQIKLNCHTFDKIAF